MDHAIIDLEELDSTVVAVSSKMMNTRLMKHELLDLLKHIVSVVSGENSVSRLIVMRSIVASLVFLSIDQLLAQEDAPPRTFKLTGDESHGAPSGRMRILRYSCLTEAD